jgi:glycine cleavage system H protein
MDETVKFTKDHEWIKVKDNTATVGITDFAQKELGEIVFVELPQVGRILKKGDPFCVVESTKAASDVYAPVSGKVVEVNSALEASPTLLNSNPFDHGWLARLEELSLAELGELMSEEEYKVLIEGC